MGTKNELQIFEPPNKVLGEVLSPQTLELMSRVENVFDIPIRFEWFQQHETLQLSNHYASGYVVNSIPTVYLNCLKVLGYVDLIVNHELLHILISIEENPSLTPYRKDDNEAIEIARLIRSIIEHPIIQQRQINMGISDEGFQNMQVRKTIYCSPPSDIESTLHKRDGLRYVEFNLLCKNKKLLLLLDKEYEKYAINARQLGKILLNQYRKHGGSISGKVNVKKILIDWLKTLEFGERLFFDL